MKKLAIALFCSVSAIAASSDARAFTHVVMPGETLAQIAQRVYGDPKLEVVLVGANALDAHGGATIVPGMRIEVPSPGHHRVKKGETWFDIALKYLGDKRRSDLLATINRGVAWIPPVDGQEILIPAVVTHIAGEGETENSVWDRYMPDPGLAWQLNNYNFREGINVKRAEVLLVPMPQLTLTDDGKAEARHADETERAEGSGARLETQRKAEAELPVLLSDVRYGRYAEAVARGNRLLGTGVLTRPQLAIVHRALVEAYVALDASTAAVAECTAWRTVEPSPKLDAAVTSPKIRAACGYR
jgi:LysM repeat protein